MNDDEEDEELRRLAAEWSALPDVVKIRSLRRSRLDRCLRLRKHLPNPSARAALKRDQILLLNLRVWRSTGVEPKEN
jgi:hypothetical protein